EILLSVRYPERWRYVVSDTAKVAVVGGGLMGSGIAEVCGRSGLDVVVTDVSAEALARARARISNSLARAVTKGKLTPEERTGTEGRLPYTVDADECADRDLVIEAVAENEAVKSEVFARLDKIVARPDAILASNPSSIPI